jgi:hypothetical protein
LNQIAGGRGNSGGLFPSVCGKFAYAHGDHQSGIAAVPDYIKRVKAGEFRLMGFGHRVYKLIFEFRFLEARHTDIAPLSRARAATCARS